MNSGETMVKPIIIFTLAMLGFSAFCLYACRCIDKSKAEAKKNRRAVLDAECGMIVGESK